jgi:hypothetical protein
MKKQFLSLGENDKRSFDLARSLQAFIEKGKETLEDERCLAERDECERCQCDLS